MNNALYYPTIEFEDVEWLWGASLLWDNIFRIVPDNYEPQEPDNLRALMDEGEIGLRLSPTAHAEEIAREFIETNKAGEWRADALRTDYSDDPDFIDLNKGKVGEELRNLILAKGGTQEDDWYRVPSSFGSLYMVYLARKMAEKNNLALVSDFASAWVGSTYFGYGDNLEDFPDESMPYQLAHIVIQDFIPENLINITPEELLKFRRERKDERRRFMEVMRTAASGLSNSMDKEVIEAQLEVMKKDITTAVSDYKKSMDMIKVTGWAGMKSISVPLATGIAKSLIPIVSTTMPIVAPVTLGLGLIYGLRSIAEKEKKLAHDSEYSYLFYVDRLGYGKGMDRLHETLNSKMNEFLYD